MKPSLTAIVPAMAAAALAAAAPAAAQYMEFAPRRLFTAPEERMRLDRDRASAAALPAPGTEPAVPVTAPPAAQAPPTPPVPARLTGVVRRSDGRATVWIDDEPHETTLGRLRPGSPVPVDTPAGPVLVKPGQTYDPNDGTIRDPR